MSVKQEEPLSEEIKSEEGNDSSLCISDKVEVKCEVIDNTISEFDSKDSKYLEEIQVEEVDLKNEVLTTNEDSNLQNFDNDHLSVIAAELDIELMWCSKCTYRTGSLETLRVHMKQFHNLKGIELNCNLCDFKTTSKVKLNRHIKAHKGEDIFKCKVCEYETNRKFSLKIHMRTHTGDKPFACNLCNFKAAQKGSIRTHLQIHVEAKRFACSACEFRTDRKHTLKKHTAIHTGEKPYVCNLCVFKTARSDVLKKHNMRLHSEQPDLDPSNAYELKSCSTKNIVTRHTKIHTTEKLFKCDLCKFKSTRKTDLSHHITVHQEKKPLRCNECEFTCFGKYSLTRHMKIHTG